MEPRLNRKLLLETPVRVSDGAGGQITAWETLGTLWAELLPVSGGAGTRGDLAAHTQTYDAILRGAGLGASNRPVPGQRMRDGIRVYHVDAVSERDGTGFYLVVRVREELMP